MALSCPSHSLLREIAKKKKLISNNHEVFVKVEKNLVFNDFKPAKFDFSFVQIRISYIFHEEHKSI